MYLKDELYTTARGILGSVAVDPRSELHDGQAFFFEKRTSITATNSLRFTA
jgi:hypothetical protein